MKYVEVRQRGYKDCATACLLSIIKYYGGDALYEELNILLKVDNNGTNAYNILNTSRSFGFDGYGCKCNVNDLHKYKNDFPVILHTNNNCYYHFVVLYEIKKDKFIIMDPNYGIVKLNYEELKNIYLNSLLVLYPTKRITKCNNILSFNKYIISLFKSFKIDIINISILSIIIVIISLIYNLYLKIILEYNLKLNYLIILSIIFLNILLIKNIMSFIRNRCMVNFNKKISIVMNNEIIKKIFNLPYLFFKNKSTGEVIYRINDLNNFKNIIVQVISELFLDFIMVILCLIILCILNYKLFFIVIMFSFVYFVIEICYKKSFKSNITKLKSKSSYYNKKLTEYISSYESIKNIDMLNNVCDELNLSYNDSINEYVNFNKYLSNQLFFKNLLVDLFYILVIFFGTFLTYNNKFTFSNLIIFLTLIGFYIEPLKNIFSIFPRFYECKEMYSRINDLIVVKSNVCDNISYKISGDIEIKNLSYSYNGKDLVLDNISLLIKNHSNILIFGDSGVGKSTLFKILLKYICHYKGEIFLNFNDLNFISNQIIANSFTYVSQKENLINDSIKNNIIFFRDISEEDYLKVIDICMLNDFIKSRKFKDNQFIEEDGFNISGGERQKLILARALLKESNYLILDEALSEIPFEEEIKIFNNIKKYYSGKTIIYSSHKEEMIKEFENVYYIERRSVL